MEAPNPANELSKDVLAQLDENIRNCFKQIATPQEGTVSPTDICEKSIKEFLSLAKNLETSFINIQTNCLNNEAFRLMHEIDELEGELHRKDDLIRKATQHIQEWEQTLKDEISKGSQMN